MSDQLERVENVHAERYAEVQSHNRTTENMARSLEIQMVRGFEDLALKSSAVLADQADLRRIIDESQDIISDRLKDHTNSIDTTLLSDRIGASVDERLASGFGAIAASLDQSLERLAQGLMHFGDAQKSAIEKLDGFAVHPLTDEMKQLSKSLEAGLSSGFADLARILDVIVAAQSLSAAREQVIDPGRTIEPTNVAVDIRMAAPVQDLASLVGAEAISAAFRASRRN